VDSLIRDRLLKRSTASRHPGFVRFDAVAKSSGDENISPVTAALREVPL